MRLEIVLAATVAALLVSCTGEARDTSAVAPTPDPSTSTSDASQEPAPLEDSDMSPPRLALLRTARSQPVEDPYYPDTSNPEVDALHYALTLDWDGSRLVAATELTFRAAQPTDQIRLDLSRALRASEVTLDDEQVSYAQAIDGIEIETGPLDANSIHTVRVEYSGTPRSTPAPSGRADMTEGLGWNVDPDGSVHTYQEPYGAFTWYAVNDHPSDKALYDASITTHDGAIAVFNGELVSKARDGDETTSHWRLDAPAASYLITLAVGDYSRTLTKTSGGMRIAYWLRPQDADLLPGLRREGNKAFTWLERHVGPYPFSTLGVVVVGGASAMETQTMITMSRGAVERSDAVLQHELAHQWYGDSVTPSDWQGLWLNEGWAMYMQQWYERDTGRVVYGGGLAQWRSLDQQSRDRSGPPGDFDPQKFGDLNVYLGPAMMLEAIRSRIGAAAFARLVKAWPAEHRNSTVDRATFTRWLRSETGENLKPLVDRWLDSPRTPALDRP